MFETAAFNKSQRLTMDIERKTYTKRNYSFGNTSVDFYNSKNVYNESNINYGSKINHAYKLTMDYLNDEEWEWVSELIYSPQIYMEYEGSYYPVGIKETNFEYSKIQNNQLRALEVNIDINQQRNGYRR